MRKTFSYREAARLLGNQQNAVVAALDKIVGGVLLSTPVGVPSLLGWFDAKVEFVRLSRQLVAGLSDRFKAGRRHDRTEALEAAHTILVVTAFFEVLADLDLPFRFRELELSDSEQKWLANDLLFTPTLIPSPLNPYERNLREIGDYYKRVTRNFIGFIQGLAVWDSLDERARTGVVSAARDVPEQACRRYDELFRQLVVDFPEVACWASMGDHQATRAEVSRLNSALSRLESKLEGISAGRAPSERRDALARTYRLRLERPVLDAGELSQGFQFQIPSLAEAYIDPRFRAAEIKAGDVPSSEHWWDGVTVRSDLHDVLIGYLTSLEAVQAPMLVLGQPGSGKSKLTQVLAARLPPSDFLPVRVALCDVPADEDPQDQIEHAIRAATGEHVPWPDLARSAGDALPVVMLDGFDELLQATGVSQTNYLLKVQAFQRREADQGRPLAVLVTSRIAVADRARIPERTIAMRLEAFDAAQVEQWLQAWNTVNASQLADRGLAPLSTEIALKCPELAEQPLLLTMMALYDADNNALQHALGQIHRTELYERLMTQFARRQVIKQQADLSDEALGYQVESELRRLSLAAFAMFNRGSHWVTQADLDDDLAILTDTDAPTVNRRTLRAPLSAAELTIGRFFFIHQARALRDDQQLKTYEFLHATFGEFLIARLIWRTIRDIAERESAATWGSLAGVLDDSSLYALLSFAPLCLQAPIIRFLNEMADEVPTEERAAVSNVLIRLFRAAHKRRPERAYSNYEPSLLPVPTRHAAYSANLVLLIVIAAGRIRGSNLFGDKSTVIQSWHAETLLWRSQLNSSNEWTSIVKTFALERIWDGGQRDIGLSLDDGNFVVPPTDPYWTYERAPQSRDNQQYVSYSYPTQRIELLLRKAHFACGLNEDVLSHTIEPFAHQLAQTVNNFVDWWPDGYPSPAHALLQLMLNSSDGLDSQEQADRYLRCVRVGIHNVLPRDSVGQQRYLSLVLDRMSADSNVPAAAVFEALQLVGEDYVATSLVLQCILAVLDRDPFSAIIPLYNVLTSLDKTKHVLVDFESTRTKLLHLELWVRLGEFGVHKELQVRWTSPQLVCEPAMSTLDQVRPDLVGRARRLCALLYPNAAICWHK